MECKEIKKIQYLYDTIVCKENNESHKLYYHIEVHEGVEENFEYSVKNMNIPEEVRELGGSHTLKVGISLDDNEFILNIASIVVTGNNIVNEEVMQIVGSLNVFRDEDIELYLKIIGLINGDAIENEKIAKQKEQEFKATIEKMSDEFKHLKFKKYDEGED